MIKVKLLYGGKFVNDHKNVDTVSSEIMMRSSSLSGVMLARRLIENLTMSTLLCARSHHAEVTGSINKKK